ncbi:MAG: hypothetical protein K2P68_05630 [Sphingomonas sp.]|nr:hypothetical protein [Sphingomonas sp.]
MHILGIAYVAVSFAPVALLWLFASVAGFNADGDWMERYGAYIWISIVFGFPVVWFVKLCADQVAPSGKASSPALKDDREHANG